MKLSIRDLFSKVSKVVSDKPAYKKKEKTDTGYVWRYDEKHIEKRWKEKKDKLKKLEKTINKLRKSYEKDLSSDDPRTRAIAAVVGIMDDTGMRIGNEESAKEADTYGATTLKVKHVKIKGNTATFDFPGKGAVEQHTEVSNAKVVKVIKELMKGKKGDDFIFEVDGKKIWDRAVNRYLASLDNISAKDIRGFKANTLMKEMLKKNKNFDEALKEVAEIVGHKASTLKNQYLDPELVEKHDKKKEAFIIYAEEESKPLDIFQPISSPESKELGTSFNIANIHPRSELIGHPELEKLWTILAPFMPGDVILSSGYRDSNDQVKPIIETWMSLTWPDGRRAVPSKFHGFFHTNFGSKLGLSAATLLEIYKRVYVNGGKLTNRDDKILSTVVEFMRNYKPLKLKNEPKDGLHFALPGRSAHQFGLALDISGSNLNKIKETAEYVLKITNTPYKEVRLEPAQNAVHIELSGPISMPDKNTYNEALSNFNKNRKKASIDSLAAFSPDDKAFFDKLVNKMNPQPAIQTSNVSADKLRQQLKIRPNVKLNNLILDAWRTLSAFLPEGAVMTSGYRTVDDQLRVLNHYWNSSGASKAYPDIKNDTERSQLLKANYGIIVLPPNAKYQYGHMVGNAFDISGADIDDIANIVSKVSSHDELPVKFTFQKEPANNAVHVNILEATYNPLAIQKVLNDDSISLANDDSEAFLKVAEEDMNYIISEIYDDLMVSNPPQDVVDSLKHIEAWRISVDDGKLNIELSPNTPDIEISEDNVGFAKDSPPISSKKTKQRSKKIIDKDKHDHDAEPTNLDVVKNDKLKDENNTWLEKHPQYMKRKPNESYNVNDITTDDVDYIVQHDPKKYFYLGLNRVPKFKKQEYTALKNVLPYDASFYFKFDYFKDKNIKIKKLLQDAAEFLAQQNPRAFFYYHLHQKFPELGRGAIIQLVDTNPDSFFDLGMDKEYPDYIEQANNARNIKDPNKIELEMPEWLNDEPNSPLSPRDRNASTSLLISKRANEGKAFKTCSCGKEYPTFNDFFAQPFKRYNHTGSIETDPGLMCYSDFLDYDLLYRDCDCLSTMTIQVPCIHKKKVDAKYNEIIKKIAHDLKLDHLEDIKIYMVDGSKVRDRVNEFTLGGHHYVYDIIPEDEIWVENTLKNEADIIAILIHEFSERMMMKHLNYEYPPAHEIANKPEEALRHEHIKNQASLLISKRAGRLKSPPKMLEEISNWVRKNVLGLAKKALLEPTPLSARELTMLSKSISGSESFYKELSQLLPTIDNVGWINVGDVRVNIQKNDNNSISGIFRLSQKIVSILNFTGEINVATQPVETGKFLYDKGTREITIDVPDSKAISKSIFEFYDFENKYDQDKQKTKEIDIALVFKPYKINIEDIYVFDNDLKNFNNNVAGIYEHIYYLRQKTNNQQVYDSLDYISDSNVESSKQFIIDVSDSDVMKSYTNEIAMLKRQGKFNELSVVMETVYTSGPEAYYTRDDISPKIVLCKLVSDVTKAFENKAEISDVDSIVEAGISVLDHELVHMMQGILTGAVNLKRLFEGGKLLPSERPQRTKSNKPISDAEPYQSGAGIPHSYVGENYKKYTLDNSGITPEDRDIAHATSDIEFYPTLANEIWNMRSNVMMRELTTEEKSLINAFNLNSKNINDVKSDNPALFNKLISKRFSTWLSNNYTVNILKQNYPQSYNKIVRELYREFSNIRTASKKWKDQLPGGLADKKSPEDFNQHQLNKGIKIELEHVNNKELAKEIAMDHLVEDEKYYDKLEQVERKS